MTSIDRCDDATRGWVRSAVGVIDADANRSADTHLLSFPLPSHWGVQLYLKDESTHPTGSPKHRLARSLFRDIERLRTPSAYSPTTPPS